MQRYSLYIDHQLVSGLIRQLQNIVKTCYEELDQEYETYELRTSIYEEFVFQITALFNSTSGLKTQHTNDDEVKKFYELTAKLEGINANAKLQDIQLYENAVKKGRPSKYKQAEESLVQWIRSKFTNQTKLKLNKKQIDSVYLQLIPQKQKKVIPVNTYLRILKKYDLKDVTIIARGGKQKTINDLSERKSFNESFWKKQEMEQSTIKHQYHSQSELQSTSELQSQFQDGLRCKQAHMITKSSRIHDGNINWSKRNSKYSQMNTESKKDIKVRKKREKKNAFKNIFDDNSDQEDPDSDWNNNLSMSHELMDNLNMNPTDPLIYENSKSFQ